MTAKHDGPDNDIYWLNKLMYDTQSEDKLAAYKASPEAFLAGYPMSAGVAEAVRRNDVQALYRAGANPYLLVYHSRLIGRPDGEIVAALHSLQNQAPAA